MMGVGITNWGAAPHAWFPCITPHLVVSPESALSSSPPPAPAPWQLPRFPEPLHRNSQASCGFPWTANTSAPADTATRAWPLQPSSWRKPVLARPGERDATSTLGMLEDDFRSHAPSQAQSHLRTWQLVASSPSPCPVSRSFPFLF